MRFSLRRLARFLLLLVAASALYPALLPQAFALGAVAALPVVQTMHHDDADADDAMASHAAMAHAGDCAGCADHQAPAPCDDLQHLCCPGHLPGYPAMAGTGDGLFPAPAGTLTADRRLDNFSSRVPDGLERPPRSVSA